MRPAARQAATIAPGEREFGVIVGGWFDGEQHHDAPATFHIVDGRIAAIDAGDCGEALSRRGAPVHRGQYLIPGLVDAHVHLFLDGALTEAAARSQHLAQAVPALVEAARANARQALGCGVTIVRDAGDRHGINHRIRDEARQPGADLAQVRSAGLGIRRAKRYGSFMAAEVGDAADIRRSVAGLAADSDEIKIILTGIIDFDAGAVTDEPQFDAEHARVAVQAAREHGRTSLAHCSGARGLAVAIAAGVGSIEHGFFMTRETLAQMAERAIAWTPTFCPVHFQWSNPQAAGWPPQTVAQLRRILDGHQRHLQLAREAGVRLLLGTDAGSTGVEHGYAVLEEIDRYLEAGLGMRETLEAATANARRHFGFEHPRLERGAPFEAVTLDGSPFVDAAALRGPLQVWRAS